MPSVVKFPQQSCTDIPSQLRALADRIESGGYGLVHGMSWSADCGGGQIEVGYYGQAPDPAMNAHFLLAMGMRKLELL